MFIGTSLYYFTTRKKYSIIARTGVVEPEGSFLLPPSSKSKLVLLTSDARPDLNNIGLGDADDLIVRLTIRNGRDFISWKDYVAANRLPKDWCAKVEAGRDPGKWYVCSRRVLKTEILEAAISDTDLGVDMMALRRASR